MKKYLFLIPTLFIGILASCGGGNNKDAEIAQLKEEIAQLKSQQSNLSDVEEAQPQTISKTNPTIADYAGTYSFTDDIGDNYILVINSDGGVTLTSPSKHIYYGSAEYYDYSDTPYIKFDYGSSDPPSLNFAGGRKLFFLSIMDIDKEYVYNDISSFKSKNPNFRLKLK